MESAKRSIFQRIPYIWKCAAIGVLIGFGIPLITVLFGTQFPGRLSDVVFLVLLVFLLPVMVFARYGNAPGFVNVFVHAVLWGGVFLGIGALTKGKPKKTFWISVAVFLLIFGFLEFAIFFWTPWIDRTALLD